VAYGDLAKYGIIMASWIMAQINTSWGSIVPMRGRLQIGVLGELTVALDGKPVPLPASKKTRALLAYLAIVGRPLRRDHLCALLWEGPDDPRAALRWSLHKIRRIANGDGQERLIADNSRAFLDPQMIELDFRRISRLRPNDLDALSTTNLESLAEASEQPFLEGLFLPRCPKFEAWRVHHADAVASARTRILNILEKRTSGQSERTQNANVPLAELDADTDSDRASVMGPSATSSADCPHKIQDIRFCRGSDGVQIAYAICGRGPPLVRAAHWMSHLKYDWQSPVWRHWMEALSNRTTLVRYDQRGNGLSDRDVGNVAFEAMVEDLESVVEAAQFDRFTLLGVSQSCAVSAAYAARHPERLSGLILYGGFVKGWRKRANHHEISAHEAMTTLIREGWGADKPAFRQLFTTMFIPGANRDQTAWFNELQRITVSPHVASRLHEAFGEIDVSPLLAKITCSTLVLHARHDSIVPFYAGREFATGISGAHFVELDSENHILLADEPAFVEFCSEVGRFLTKTAS
jgi:pimeloyl-ACP methyl ester carboxylesterase